MGCCANPPVEDISEDDCEVAIGGARPSIRQKRLSRRPSSRFQTKKLYSSRASECSRRRLVTFAHKEVLKNCRGLLDKLDQCDTRSTDWNNWIMEIVYLLLGIKLKNKAQEASDQARQLLSDLLSKGTTEDKAIGNHFLKLTDNYYGSGSSFMHHRAHSSNRSQPRLLLSERVIPEMSTTEEYSIKNTRLETDSYVDSQLGTPGACKFGTSAYTQQFPGTVRFPGLKNLLTWNFDLFAFSDQTNRRPLSTMFLYICSQMQIETAIEGINIHKLSSYIQEVESHYGNNPYHNFIHGADVVHSCLNLMETDYLQQALDQVHRFALVFAAAIHDFRHPGVGNDFLVNTSHEIATTYNDTSVLENWHTSQAFLLLKKSEFNFLGKVEDPIKTLIRKRVIYAVLMTDMKRHGEHVEELQVFLDTKENSSEIIDPGILMAHCLHASDLSHPTKEFSLHWKWSSKLIKEFLRQGDKELELGMEPGALYDRRKVNLEKSQIGFIDFIVLPLWVNWTTLIGEGEEFVDQIHTNKDEWLRLVNLNEKEKESFSFSEVKVKDKAEHKEPQSPKNKGPLLSGGEGDEHESKLMPSQHLAEVNITSPHAIKPKVIPISDEQQKLSSTMSLHPDLELGCRISYPVLNHARVSNEILVLPEDPKIEDKDSLPSNSNSQGSALPDFYKAPGNLNYLQEPQLHTFDRDSSVINMYLDEDEVERSPRKHSGFNVFQLQNIGTESSHDLRWTNRLTLGTVESNSFLD